MFEWVEYRLLAKGLKFWGHSYKLSRKNTQAGNMCDIVFKKGKGRGGTVNRISSYGEAAVRRVL